MWPSFGATMRRDHLTNRGSDRAASPKRTGATRPSRARGTGFLFTPRGTRRERVQINAKPCFCFPKPRNKLSELTLFLSSTLFWRFGIGDNGDFGRKKNHSNLNSVARQRNDWLFLFPLTARKAKNSPRKWAINITIIELLSKAASNQFASRLQWRFKIVRIFSSMNERKKRGNDNGVWRNQTVAVGSAPALNREIWIAMTAAYCDAWHRERKGGCGDWVISNRSRNCPSLLTDLWMALRFLWMNR